MQHRCRALRDLLGQFAETEELHSKNSADLWREIRDVGAFLDSADQNAGQVWRLSVPPMDGAKVVQSILPANDAQVFYDWGGGLVWLGLEGGSAAEAVRGAVSAVGGHATLIRVEPEVRARVPVFEPQSGALKDLSARVKKGFDPNGVLNPGRLYEGV